MSPRRSGQSDGIFRIRSGWAVRVMVGGVRRQATFQTRQEAEDARHQVRGRAIAARLGIVQPDSHAVPTVGWVLDGYATECEALGRSPAHVRSVRQARDLIVRWAGEFRDARLTRGELIDFVVWSRVHTASKGRAIHNALVILRTALRRADLPVPASPRLELPARTPKTLDRKQLARLLAQLPLGTVTRTAIEIGLRTGAREAEIRRLRVEDLDLKRRTLLLRRAKGRPGRRGSEEVVPVSPGLARALAAYVARLPAGLAAEAPLLGRPSFRRTLEAACRAADVPVRTTIGWTRAQAATLAREAGMPLGVVSGTLGHVDPDVTRQHYDESSREVSERWTARLAAGKVLDRTLDGKRRQVSPVLRPATPRYVRAKALKRKAGP